MAGPPSYRGSAWNARFLYAPKIALELDQRTDFVSLRSLASVKLGVKTGADDFFFLTIAEGRPRSPSYRHVKGFRGWIGDLSKADLLMAVRNPRDLTHEGVRLFRVPRRIGAFYLYPTGRGYKADLREYVERAEEAGVDDRPLVRDNAGDDEWFVQARGIVQPDWILPYNSAYDYGAFENETGAVINGRFVGVTTMEDVDSELLGAALNSTFVIVERLIEGVPTGNEGAFDVGPPAARLMKVPDVRAMHEPGVEQVRTVLNDLRRVNEMPKAPNRDGHVSELRRRLDDAVLYALGVSAGDRAVLLDRLYASYGRWRSSVEDVEMRMRANRRTTARLGLSRGESPVVRASRTVWDEMRGDYLALPSDLLEETDSFDTVDISPSYRGIGQDALFGEGLVPDGHGGTIDLRSINRLEYGMLLRDLGFGRILDIVRGDHRAADIVRRARDEIVRFIEEAAVRARRYVGQDVVGVVVDGAKRLWYEHCRGEYRRWIQTRQENSATSVALGDLGMMPLDGGGN
jgi:hypothetical protein